MTKLLPLLILLAGCWPPKPAQRPVAGETTCETACQNLTRMSCESGQPSDGTSCEDLCEEIVDYGIPYPIDCVTRATTCQDADRCQ